MNYIKKISAAVDVIKLSEFEKRVKFFRSKLGREAEDIENGMQPATLISLAKELERMAKEIDPKAKPLKTKASEYDTDLSWDDLDERLSLLIKMKAKLPVAMLQETAAFVRIVAKELARFNQ